MLEIPNEWISPSPSPSGSGPSPPKTTKLLVEDQVFGIKDSMIMVCTSSLTSGTSVLPNFPFYLIRESRVCVRARTVNRLFSRRCKKFNWLRRALGRTVSNCA